MKIKALAALLLAAGLLSSCNNNEGTSKQKTILSFGFELDQTSAEETYTPEGYWTDVYNPDVHSLVLANFMLMSHSALVQTWDGVEYASWKGFCPSRSTDNADHTGGDWTKYQWGSITGGGAFTSLDYVLGCWDVQESTETIPENPTCLFQFADEIEPQGVRVTNSAYGYYAMLYGTAFNKAFDAHDWCTLIITGLKDGRKTGSITVDLARDGEILKTWKEIDLSPLGKVKQIYFQMESSDTGQWGMNNPAYFCLDNLEAIYEF